MLVYFLVTLANETFINMIFDSDNCIVIKKFCKTGISVAGVMKKFTTIIGSKILNTLSVCIYIYGMFIKRCSINSCRWMF